MAENDNRPLDDLAVDFKVEDGIPNSEDPFGDFPSDFSTDIQPGELTGQPQSSELAPELTPESEPEPGPAEISPETPLPEAELPETEPPEIPPSEVPLEPICVPNRAPAATVKLDGVSLAGLVLAAGISRLGRASPRFENPSLANTRKWPPHGCEMSWSR